jgi:hypothetical protein
MRFIISAIFAVCAVFHSVPISASPDINRTIMLVAWAVPHPLAPQFEVMDTNSVYHFRHIADAGFNAVTLPWGAGWDVPGNTLEANKKLLEAARSVMPEDTLWVIALDGTMNQVWVDTDGNAFADTTKNGIDNPRSISAVDWAYGRMKSDIYADDLVMGWYLMSDICTFPIDRPSYCHFESVSRLDSVVRVAHDRLATQDPERYRPNWMTVAGLFGTGNSRSRYTDYMDRLNDQMEVAPNSNTMSAPVFGVELYRFRDRSQGAGCSYPVTTLNAECHRLWDVADSAGYRHPYWSVTRITDEINIPCPMDDTPPSEEALRTDIFTRLAWGAKGIVYYAYMHHHMEGWWDPTGPNHWPGVYNDQTVVQDSTGYRATELRPLHTWLGNINRDIRHLDPYLGPSVAHRPVMAAPHSGYKKSKFKDTAEHLTTPSEFIRAFRLSYVKSSADCWRPVVNAIATPFTDTTGAEDTHYVLVVNQSECNQSTGEVGGTIDIEIELDVDNLLGVGTYRVRDLLDGRTWLLERGALPMFTDRLTKGAARMYAIEPVDR